MAIDPRPIVRLGIAGVAREAFNAPVHAVPDPGGATTVMWAAARRPGLALLGLSDSDAVVELTREARQLGCPVVCVLCPASERTLAEAVTAQLDGYLLSEGLDAPALRAAMDRIDRGEPPAVPELDRHAGARPAENLLTARCQEVMQHAALGLHDGEIADQLGLSVSSVRKHIRTAQMRMRTRTRSETVARLVRAGAL